MARAAVLLCIVASCQAASVNVLQENKDSSELNANPIRKVVTLLQNMQKKVTAEGEKEQALFEKFMCYCKNADSTLGKSISDAETKIPETSTSIEEGAAKKVQLEDEVKSAMTGRSEAKDAIAKATSIREKENAAFKKESGEYKSNIDAMKGAISAISSGMAGGFLQTNTAATVRKIALEANMEDVDRQEIMAFLSGKQSASTGYMPKSGEITGILKTMEDEMSKTLADITADEESSAASFKELVAAKAKEIEALTKAIEVKSKRVGELGIEIAMMKNDLSDTEEALLEDKKFYADLSQNCAKKQGEWDEIQQQRAQELVALADTIKILNDDDALELFKKTLPGASNLLQVTVSKETTRTKALAIIGASKKTHPASPQLGFVELALGGKKMGFEKVVKLIDDMVVVLKKEQIDDETKKEYCTTQLDTVEDKKKVLEQSVSDLETSISDAKEGIAAVKSELEALEDGVKALDKAVAEATEQRKEEHADFTELLATDASAKDILGFAKNRLNKFYNPKAYKAPPKRNLSFVQVSSHNADEPAPAPEAPKAFKKKGEESNGVIAMIDLLVVDLDKEMQTAQVEEKSAQKAYETTMADSAAKRAEDSKLMTEKTGAKAQLETELEESKEGKISTTKELMATAEYESSLHGECDWLLKNFDVRKEARASEVDALGKAKAVLSGADFSFIQKGFLNRH
jgi:septal ring factor EnvC (AmiA/AmiB activator)